MSTLFVDTINEKTSGNGIQIPGHVVQVVQEDVNTQYSANNIKTQTFIRDTAFTAKYANSKLIIMMNVGGCSNGGSTNIE